MGEITKEDMLNVIEALMDILRKTEAKEEAEKIYREALLSTFGE